ncbi:Mu transposase C-terminal domain-containing protein [Peribacillus frigoritolerans]|uniref:Mu transposase C-terminal domain-containing protein n=1 Tax=Peribacillus frigoritolerans TaxID=450367 RepID=UPI003B8CA921
MGQIHIGTGIRFQLNNRSYEIEREVEKDTYSVYDIEFPSVMKKFTREQIAKLLQEGNLRFSEIGKNTNGALIKKYDFDDFSMLSEKLQEKALFRLDVIKPLINLEVDSMNPYVKARIEELNAEGKKVSRASIYRWLKDYRFSHNDIRSLVPSFHRSGNDGKRLMREVEIIIDQIIDKYYLAKERRTVKTIFELSSHQINLENKNRSVKDQLQLPSESTVLRRIREREEYDVTKARKGKQAAWNKFGQVNPFEKPSYPLQRVEADHTRLDLFVVDDENRLPMGRPTITSLLDIFTGYPLGIYIGFEPPSYTSVMHALNHAIFPKSYIKTKYPELNNQWVAHGLPEVLIVDNGKEFLSKHLEHACKQLQIELVRCPVKKPWYKGSVERHFRTINQSLLHQTKGTTFSNILDKGEYDPEKNAIVGFKQLLAIFHKWIVDYYALNFNKGVKGAPIKLWEKSFEFILSPALPSSSIDWKIILMKLGKGSIQRTGIRFRHLYFQSESLFKLWHEITKKSLKNSVEFKYDPTDLSKIYVYNPFNFSYIETMCTNQEYTQGLNEYTHNVIIKKLNEEAKDIDKEALAAARYELEQMIAGEQKQTLSERRKVHRHKGTGSDKEWTTEEKKDVESVTEKIKFESEPKELELPKLKKEKKVVNLFKDIDMDDWGILDAE